MRPSKREKLRYVLIFKNDFTFYSLLRPYESSDSDSTVTFLNQWIAAFGKTE